jgi:hypothetical protein
MYTYTAGVKKQPGNPSPDFNNLAMKKRLSRTADLQLNLDLHG